MTSCALIQPSLLFATILTSLAATCALVDGKPFVHPGLLHTKGDFERMKAKVAAGEEPWISGWRKLEQSRHAQTGWKPRPQQKVVRGGEGQNFPVLCNDIHAAYQLALRWKVSGDTKYADKSVEILNLWSGTLKSVTGNSDRFLAAGIYGYQFANAGEIMRTYEGWKPRDLARFQKMMLEIFYPMNRDFLTRHNGADITNYWANWDLCNMASLQAIGVFCDRRDLYDEALGYFRNGRGNGAIDKAVYYVHPGNLGQWQESGRDQGHNTLGIALMGPFLEAAWNQGDDLYGFDNNRFLAGAEYVAKYNLGADVPYQLYAWGTGPRGDHREQPGISAAGRPSMRLGFELVVNHYVRRKGIAAPWSERYAEKMRPEGAPGGHASAFDQFGLGTLTHTLAPQVENPAPSGLTARKSGAQVILSWWGAAGADSYRVKRTAAPDAPVTIIAADLKDPFTFTDTAPLPDLNYYAVTAMRGGEPVASSNVVRVQMKPKLVTHYDFDAPSGTVVRDQAGKADSAVQPGVRRTKGAIGNAIALDGKSGHLALPKGILSKLSDFTIATWVHPDSERTWARVCDFGDDRGHYLFLSPRGSNGKPRFAVSTTYGHNQQAVDGSEALPLRQWTHLAFTLSGRTGTLYVNGSPAGSNRNLDFPPFRLGPTSRNWLGRSQFPNDPFFEGALDDFRIYDGALTPAEIATLAAGREEPGR